MKLNVFAIVVALAMSVGVAHAQQNNPTNAKERVELQCGTHIVAITCGKSKPGDEKDERICVHNTLSFVGKDGKIVYPKQQKTFIDPFVVEKTPTGISCENGSDGINYVIVRYVAGPLYSSKATTIEIFLESGERLTINGKNRRGVNKIFNNILSYTSKESLIEEYGK
jgi:hypothetical protein